MILCHFSVNGEKHLGFVHVGNVTGLKEQSEYEVTLFDESGDAKTVAHVTHNRSDGWLTLIAKATAALVKAGEAKR